MLVPLSHDAVLGCCSGVMVLARSDDEALVRQLYPSLRRFAAVVGSGNVEPDDLVHDALVATMRSYQLRDLEAPEAYLRRAMVNLAKNARRNRWRREAFWSRQRVELSHDPTYPSDLDELERLAPDERAVLYLKVVEDRPYAEIAAMLGITEVAARARASRAANRLKALLVEELEHG